MCSLPACQLRIFVPQHPCLCIAAVICKGACCHPWWQVAMKKAAAGDETRVKTCWATLQKYCGNIAQVGAPFDPLACTAEWLCLLWLVHPQACDAALSVTAFPCVAGGRSRVQAYQLTDVCMHDRTTCR